MLPSYVNSTLKIKDCFTCCEFLFFLLRRDACAFICESELSLQRYMEMHEDQNACSSAFEAETT